MLIARSDTDETRIGADRTFRHKMRLPRSLGTRLPRHTRTHATPHTHSTYTVPGPLRGINPRCDTARSPSRGSNAGGQAGHCQRYHRATRSFAYSCFEIPTIIWSAVKTHALIAQYPLVNSVRRKWQPRVSFFQFV